MEHSNKIVLFQDKAVRRTWFNKEWWFVIEDIIAILTNSTNPKRYLIDLKKRGKELANWSHPSMLGEASTTEITRNQNTQGFDENFDAAVDGGTIAGNARRALEKKSGKAVQQEKILSI